MAMDTEFVEEIVSINVDFDREDNILCPNDVVKAEYFNTDDIDNAMSPDNCMVQSIDSSYFTNSDDHKNVLNNITRTVMESVPYADGLQYLAEVSSDIRHITDNINVGSIVISDLKTILQFSIQNGCNHLFMDSC